MKSTNRIVSPKKLLNSKWTAAKPKNKEKHFMVTKLVLPEIIDQAIAFVEIQAVYTKRKETLPWQQLNDRSIWLQGWISR